MRWLGALVIGVVLAVVVAPDAASYPSRSRRPRARLRVEPASI